MKFPVITDIKQIRDAILNREEFIECEKDDYIVFNYLLSTNETFPVEEPILREIRGIIFNKEGKCIRRPYHKFFNIGEKPAEEVEPIGPLNTIILEKLDGSMIAPFYSNGKIRWGTKMGVTDYTEQVEEFISKNPQYVKFAEVIINNWNSTPIFEWCSNKNRIVVSHEEDKLILTAVRNITTGEYASYEQMLWLASFDKIPVVEFLHTFSQESIKEATQTEGVVVRFKNGQMLKLKSDWYVDLHKAKEAISSEKYVINMIFSNALDDLLPKLQEADQEKISKYANAVTSYFLTNCNIIGYTAALIMAKHKTVKEFALSHDATQLYPQVRSFIFKKYKDPELNLKNFFTDIILRKTGTNRGCDEIAHLYGNLKWNYNEE